MSTTNRSILALILTACALFATSSAGVAATPARETLIDRAIALNSPSSGPAQGLNGAFTTLIALVSANGQIARVLSGAGPYTVWAPTESAFADLFEDAAANCVSITPELVNSLLLYHVTDGRQDAAADQGYRHYDTLLGAFLAADGHAITDAAGRTANIIDSNQFADNGVLHAIDRVLMPFALPNQCPPGRGRAPHRAS